jgi:dienelactone hydrolase
LAQVAGALALNLALLACPASGWAADFVEEPAFFRVTIDGRTVRLQGMVVKKADAASPLPIALITHGKPSNLVSMLDMQPASYLGTARDLASRGWLAVIVMRRGFGQSDGPIPHPLSCDSTSLGARFAADADDLQATLERVGQRPDADPTRAVAIGVSAGGPAVSALAARNPKGLMGIVNVSGGLRFPSCPKEDALVAAFRDFGTRSRVPSLWVYAKNDSFFGPDLVDRMRSAYLDGGANARLVMYDSFGSDGHQLFMSGRSRWLMEMDGFLRHQELPTWQYKDASALAQKLKSQNISFLERYVAAPWGKALARSKSSDYYYMSSGYKTLELAREAALAGCQKGKPEGCAIVMENSHWVGPATAERAAGPSPTVVANHGGAARPPVDAH